MIYLCDIIWGKGPRPRSQGSTCVPSWQNGFLPKQLALLKTHGEKKIKKCDGLPLTPKSSSLEIQPKILSRGNGLRAG